MTLHVLVVGGGYAGLTAARRMVRSLPRGSRVTVLNPHGYMTYQPLLAETAAGTVQPAHVVVPLRSALPGVVRVLIASLTGLDTASQVASATAPDGTVHTISYDEIVLAVGSVTRTLPLPGLVEHAVGFRTVEEALHLGNRVLSQLDLAGSTTDDATRRRALAFVFVGAGYAGIEVLAELEDMVRRTIAGHHGLTHADTRWVMVEASDRILPPLPERLASYVGDHLRRRGVEIRTGTRVESVVDGNVLLSDGTKIESNTIVWTAGVVASPMLRALGLPVDRAGRVETDEYLRVRGVDHVWALGDCASVPDLHVGGTCSPTAQHAVRQAVRLAGNVSAALRGSRLTPYRHKDAGAVASLGLGKGVAELYGLPLRGWPAWLVHRIYHGSRLPCRRRRFLVNLIWLLGSRGRDPVALPAIESPHEPLQLAHHQQTTPYPNSSCCDPDPTDPGRDTAGAPGTRLDRRL